MNPRITTRRPKDPRREIKTPILDGDWRAAWNRHQRTLDRFPTRGPETAAEESTCFEDEVPCQGSTVLVETCCGPAEPVKVCYERHLEAVQDTIDRCGGE